jgi:HAD superfamily hydrolase (TIGR01549 family)
MKKSAVFFDLGGTLLVMRRDRILQRILENEGYSVPLREIRRAYYIVERNWLKDYGTKVLTPEETDEAYSDLNGRMLKKLGVVRSLPEASRLARAVRSRWKEVEETIRPSLYPEAEPVLKRLFNEGYSLAIVSNAPADTIDVVERLGLKRYTSAVVISGIVGYTKPNPEIFRIALRDVSCKPEETVHVGDIYEADVEGARNAGITGILIDREGFSSDVNCTKIASLDQVYKYL